MPLFGLVQARPWFRSSLWISSVAGISEILCTSEIASAISSYIGENETISFQTAVLPGSGQLLYAGWNGRPEGT